MKLHVFFAVHEGMFDGIVRQLMARGRVSGACGVVWGRNQEAGLRRPSLYSPLLRFSRDVLPLARRSVDWSYLRAAERRFDYPLRRVLLAERHMLEGRSFEQRNAILEMTIRVLDQHFARVKPDAVLTEDISCPLGYLHWLVGRSHGAETICVGQGKLSKTVSVYGNPAQRWDEMELVFRDLRTRGLSPAQRESAEAYVQAFSEEPPRPPVATRFSGVPKPSLDEFRRLAALGRAWLDDRDNPTLGSPSAAVRSRARRWMRASKVRHFAKTPRAGDYVFFPLQVQPEASTLVRGFPYRDLPATLQTVADALPVGTRVYVKEHYASIGRRPPGYYERIAAVHGVELVHPRANTIDFVRAATGVVTVSSTVGWEALLLRKPVFTLAEVFYNAHPDVVRLFETPPDAWWPLIRKGLARPPSRKATLELVAAMQKTLRPGFKANPTTFPEVLEQKNIDRLTDAVEARLVSKHTFSMEPLHCGLIPRTP